MPIPYDEKTLNEAQKKVVQENNLDSAYIRPIAFYGSEGMGIRADSLSTHISIAAWEWGAYLGEEGPGKGYSSKDFLAYPSPCQYQHVPS